MSRREILYELPSAQGWALIAWTVENNGVCEMELAGPGYIGQEAGRRKRRRK